MHPVDLLEGTLLKLLSVDGASFRELRVISQEGDGVILLDEASGKREWFAHAELRAKWLERRLTTIDRRTEKESGPARQLRKAQRLARSPAERRYMKFLAPYLIAFRKTGSEKHASKKLLSEIIKKVSEREGHEKRPGWRTVSDTLARWKASGGTGFSVPRLSARGNRSLRFGAFEATIDEYLRKHVLIRERKTLSYVQSQLSLALEVFNAKLPEEDRVTLPSIATLERRLAAIDEYTKTVAWEGERAAKRKRVKVGRFKLAERPMEFVEFDHTPADILVVHPRTKQVIGRPFITAAIDRATRMVVGLYIGFEEPSARTVMRCLRMAILPKDEIVTRYGFEKDSWPCEGHIEAIVVDNGQEFHSTALDEATEELMIDVVRCRKEVPTDKAHIEAFLKRLNKFIHTLPGTTFSNPQQRGDYDSEGKACLTVADLRRIVYRWLVEDYSVVVHTTLGKAPIVAWREMMEIHRPESMHSVTDLDVLMLEAKPASLQRKGVSHEGRWYSADRDRMTLLLNDPGRPSRCIIKSDPDDLGYIYMWDWVAGSFLLLECDDPDAHGQTLREHQAAADRARREVKDYTVLTRAKLAETREKNQNEIEILVEEGKARGRKIARISGADPDENRARKPRKAKAPGQPLPQSTADDADDDFVVSVSSLKKTGK